MFNILKYILRPAMFAIVLGLVSAQSFCLIADERSYRIGVEDLPYSPYHTTKDGKYQGASRKVLDLFAKSHNLTFIYDPKPINRLDNEFLTTDNLDFKYPDHPHWKVPEKANASVSYSSGILPLVDGVMVHKDQLKRGLDQLKELGMPRGFTPSPFQKLVDAGKVRLHENPTIRGLLKQVELKRIDGAYLNVAVARHIQRTKDKYKSLTFDPTLPHATIFYRLATRRHPEILKQFNKFLVSHRKQIEQIIKEHNIKVIVKNKQTADES